MKFSVEPKPVQVTRSQTVVKKPIKEKIQGDVQIRHLGFKPDDEKQDMVNLAYQYGGERQLIVQECENGNRDPMLKGDGGDAHGLCQMNENYHDIPKQYLSGDREFQTKYCHEKIKGGTIFYGPFREMYEKRNGKKVFIGLCKDVVRSRFQIVNKNPGVKI